MTQDYSPTEIFKRATAATLRAIAERDDVTVGFGPEPAGASGARVRLPNPPRDLPAEEAAQLRGAADSVALRLRYHDDTVHSRRAPGGPLARAVFDAVEQARVEALGARRMAGLADNLAAMLDERYRRQGYEHVSDRNNATLAEAVRLLARETLTGAPPPPSAQRVVEMWRPFLEGKVGRDLLELGRHVRDQDAYGKLARKLIQDLDLDLGETEDEAQEDDSEADGDDAKDKESDSEGGEGAAAGAQGALEGGVPEHEEDDGEQAGAEEVEGELMPGAGDDDPGRPGRPGNLPRHGHNDDSNLYRAFTTECDEVVEAEALCDADELTRLRSRVSSSASQSASASTVSSHSVVKAR